MTKRERSNNADRVLDTLRAADKPMSAYQILAVMRAEGVTAPTTVYRALDALMTRGAVHRVESLNAYLPCSTPDHDGTPVFAICTDCGTVAEEVSKSLRGDVATLASEMDFTPAQSVIEIKGLCGNCRDEGNKD